MPNIHINGQKITVSPEMTVIQAAEKAGVYIPRYCYHPGLSVAGSCRMCLVEIRQMPKLAISCHTRVQDGMHVSTNSEKVNLARKAMLEFLLINHPLDCPVCDQAGECDLQNYYMEIGQYESRFLEDKIKRQKAVPIGPHVMLDQERCILCTRCVRYCEEVTQTHELGVFNRGNRSEIALYPGKTLENPYSGNVIDICPVGALTEREFRFQCRVWYLATKESVCNGCSRGCNISIHHNNSRPHKAQGKRVQRLKPRYNPHVNGWWMCDEGRFGYQFIDQNRIETPQLRASGRLAPSDWDTVLAEVSTATRAVLDKFGPESIGVLASPQLSNEELYLIRYLWSERLGIRHLGYRNPWEQEAFQDDFLLRADRNPNRRGAEIMGLDGDVREILKMSISGEIKLLYIFHHDIQDQVTLDQLSQVEYIVFQGSNWNPTAKLAHAVLPGATHAEKEGTFTNFEGRVQRFQQAFLPLGESRDDFEILTQLSGLLGEPLPFYSAEDAFQEWFGKPFGELEPHGEIRDLK